MPLLPSHLMAEIRQLVQQVGATPSLERWTGMAPISGLTNQ